MTPRRGTRRSTTRRLYDKFACPEIVCVSPTATGCMNEAFAMKKFAQSIRCSVAPFSTTPPIAAASGCSRWARMTAAHHPVCTRQWSSVIAMISPLAWAKPRARRRKTDAPVSRSTTRSGASRAAGRPSLLPSTTITSAPIIRACGSIESRARRIVGHGLVVAITIDSSGACAFTCRRSCQAPCGCALPAPPRDVCLLVCGAPGAPEISCGRPYGAHVLPHCEDVGDIAQWQPAYPRIVGRQTPP